jgi:hypothetical protein
MSQAAAAPRVSDHVLHLLARSTADAKAGSTIAVLVVAVGPDGMARTGFAGEMDVMPSVLMGVDMFKTQVMIQALSAPGAAVMNSGIIKPGH